jgi:hypothetical protein
MRTLSPADQCAGAAEFGRVLQARSSELRRDMARTRRWKRDVPGALAAASGTAALASVAIGVAGPAAAALDVCAGFSNLFALGSTVVPYRADRAAHRVNPAFALLIGDGQGPFHVTLNNALTY